MGTTQRAARTVAAKEMSQFKLTTNTITKLNTFKLTPTAKLVLLYLTTCYNPKHKEVFPKQKTIADKLGISERSVTRAIQELFKEGLVLIECKYTNRYKFTSKIVQEQAEILSDDLRQNDTKQTDNLSHHEIEQIIETKKEQTLKSGENVYIGDDLILYEYAKKKAKYNVNALVRKIKENGGDKKIIKEYKKKNFIAQRAVNAIKETQSLLRLYASYENNTCTAESCGCSLSQLKKRGFLK